MVAKNKSTGEKKEKQGRIEVGKLKVNKETLKDLTPSKAKGVRGGVGGTKTTRGDSVITCSLGIVHLPQRGPLLHRTGDGGQ